MSVDLLKRLIEAGTPAELVAEVAAALADAKAAVSILEERKAKDRARKRIPRNSTEAEEIQGTHGIPDTPALEVSPENPLPKTTPTPPYNPPASRRGARLPDDFEPPEDWIAWAMAKRGWSRAAAIEECEVFARHWQAKPGRDACKLDWPKTWQNWVVNSRRSNRAANYDPERITV